VASPEPRPFQRPTPYICWAVLSAGPTLRLVLALSKEEAEAKHRELVPGDYDLEAFADDAEGLRRLGEGVLNNLEALGAPEEPTALLLALVIP
jgi:hypothetical protein